jgi:hypothetical protein
MLQWEFPSALSPPTAQPFQVLLAARFGGCARRHTLHCEDMGEEVMTPDRAPMWFACKTPQSLRLVRLQDGLQGRVRLHRHQHKAAWGRGCARNLEASCSLPRTRNAAQRAFVPARSERSQITARGSPSVPVCRRAATEARSTASAQAPRLRHKFWAHPRGQCLRHAEISPGVLLDRHGKHPQLIRGPTPAVYGSQ